MDVALRLMRLDGPPKSVYSPFLAHDNPPTSRGGRTMNTPAMRFLPAEAGLTFASTRN